MTKEFQENASNQLQLGALDKDLVLLFRKQAEERRFKKVDVLRIMTNWWLNMDISNQRDLYHGIGIEPPESNETSITESIEIVKHFVKYKIPSTEERRLIESLRKALAPDRKGSGSKGKGNAAAEDDAAARAILDKKKRSPSRRKPAESA